MPLFKVEVMVLMWILQNLSGPGVFYRKGDLYLITVDGMNKVRKNLFEKGLSRTVKFLEVDELFEPYLYGDQGEILIIRTGGIGDLLALSCIGEYCWQNRIKVVTARPMLPIFQWWSNANVFVKPLDEPLYRGFTNGRVQGLRKSTKRLVCEGLIEEGSTEDWYDVFFGAIGVERIHEKYMRPQLIQHRLSGPRNIDYDKPSILVIHRASAQMRSTTFETFYKAIIDIIGDEDINIYVHRNNMTLNDDIFISFSWDKRTHIIEESTVETFLLDCYDASMVISVDTGALHFREGINKPAIGIYAAFGKGCRTKHYTVTHSFELKSQCDLQPCYLHQKSLKHVCPKEVEGATEAPCMTTKLNPDIHTQLVEGMKDYLLTNLK